MTPGVYKNPVQSAMQGKIMRNEKTMPTLTDKTGETKARQ